MDRWRESENTGNCIRWSRVVRKCIPSLVWRKQHWKSGDSRVCTQVKTVGKLVGTWHRAGLLQKNSAMPQCLLCLILLAYKCQTVKQLLALNLSFFGTVLHHVTSKHLCAEAWKPDAELASLMEKLSPHFAFRQLSTYVLFCLHCETHQVQWYKAAVGNNVCKARRNETHWLTIVSMPIRDGKIILIFLPWPSFSFLPMKSNAFRPLTESTVYIGVARLKLSARDKHQIMSTNATSVSWFIAEGRQPSICDRLDRALPPSGVVSWFCLVGVWLPGWCIKV